MRPECQGSPVHRLYGLRFPLKAICTLKDPFRNDLRFQGTTENGMLVLVGSRTKDSAEWKIDLGKYEDTCRRFGFFVYPWTFNPDQLAIERLQNEINDKTEVSLYLPKKGHIPGVRMNIKDFEFHRKGGGIPYPEKWERYCTRSPEKEHHLWFLIDRIDPLLAEDNLLAELTPVFDDKYHDRLQKSFAFLETKY